MSTLKKAKESLTVYKPVVENYNPTFEIYKPEQTPEHIEAIKKQVDEHRGKKLGSRILARIAGRYPEPHEIEALKRYEKGPWGRSRDNVRRAVDFSSFFHGSLVTRLDGQWVATPQLSKDERVSLPFEITPEDCADPDSHVNRIFQPQTAAVVRAVGIVVPESEHGVSLKKIGSFDLVALSAKGRELRRVTVDEQMELDPVAVEQLTGLIGSYACDVYSANKPDGNV